MGYQQQNNSTILKAFRGFSNREETIIADGMCRVAEAGLSFLIEAHDSYGEMHHTHETNTLAYAVAKDGAIVRSEYLNGGDGDMPGDAAETARSLLSGVEGWSAIILSDMHGWYRVDWETDFLGYSRAQIASDFSRYFKKVR